MVSKPKVILLDVNETLLDLTPLKQKINDLLGSDGFRSWFGLLLHYSLVDNSTYSYHDFSALGAATFDMAATSLRKQVDPEKKKAALAQIQSLPPHPDVEEGIKILKSKGVRLATLTNSPEKMSTAQLQFSGLIGHFEKTVSIDSIKLYKPGLQTYHWGAEQMGVDVADAMLIAAHGWDVAGALHAGMQAAFISRPGQSVYPLAPPPTLTGQDLVTIANQL